MAEILTSGGDVIIIDDEDFAMLNQYKWSMSSTGYPVRGEYSPVDQKTRMVFMHREIMGLSKGDGKRVDHINENKRDNRRCNLRMATHAENMRNKGVQSNNKTGYKGVSIHNGTGKYIAMIGLNRKQIYLGLYETAEDAHKAYCEAARRLHGEFSNDGKRNMTA